LGWSSCTFVTRSDTRKRRIVCSPSKDFQRCRNCIIFGCFRTESYSYYFIYTCDTMRTSGNFLINDIILQEVASNSSFAELVRENVEDVFPMRIQSILSSIQRAKTIANL